MMPTGIASTSGVVAGEVTRTDVEQAVVEWLRTELEDPEIISSDNFLDIGGHSLTFQRLNKFLRTAYGAALDQRTTYNDELSVAVAAIQAATQPATPADEQNAT
jgi:hypothetical protein